MKSADASAEGVGFLELLGEIFVDPKAAFKSVLHRPVQWSLIVVPLSLFLGVSGLDLLLRTGVEFWEIPPQVPQLFEGDVEGYRAFSRYSGLVSVFGGTLLAFGMTSSLVWCAGRVLSRGELLFKDAMLVSAAASLISTLGAISTILLILATGDPSMSFSLKSLLPIGPELGLGSYLLVSLDLFELWYLVTLAMGLACLSRVRFRAGLLVCSLLWILPRLLAF